MKIVFFDGHCNLCNGFVDFIFRQDSKNKLKVASLQGETAGLYLNLSKLETVPESIIYLRDQEVWERSTAVLYILSDMGGIWGLFKVFLILPVSFRDWVYRWLAKNRYKIFGRRETCRLPTVEEQEKFLK